DLDYSMPKAMFDFTMLSNGCYPEERKTYYLFANMVLATKRYSEEYGPDPEMVGEFWKTVQRGNYKVKKGKIKVYLHTGKIIGLYGNYNAQKKAPETDTFVFDRDYQRFFPSYSNLSAWQRLDRRKGPITFPPNENKAVLANGNPVECMLMPTNPIPTNTLEFHLNPQSDSDLIKWIAHQNPWE
ncbi:MAG: hypothetical protein D6767_11100, partial [Candidatus Hydrogenedentota bacterium]